MNYSAKNARFLFAFMVLIAFSSLVSVPAHAQLVNYGGGTGGAIPDPHYRGNDAALAGISSTITVTDSFTIDSFGSITLNGLGHGYIGDLIITLTHGDVSVDILDRVLGNGNLTTGDGSQLLGDYTFELGGADINAAAAALSNSGIIASGIYAPYLGGGVTGGVMAGTITSPGGSSANTQTLADFAGKNVQGNWTLNISDRSATAPGGFGGWSFTVNQVPTSTGVPEPTSLVLLGLALPVIGLVNRRCKA